MSQRRPRRRSSEEGAATAELAMVLPLLLAVTSGLVWLLAVGAAQVRVVDAARETARAVARGDSPAEAVDRGLQVAPDGSRIVVDRQPDRVTVMAAGEVGGPGGLLPWPSITLRAEAVAAPEPGS